MSENTIDEKKNDTSNTEPNLKSFAYNYFYSIVFTIGFLIFIIGTFGLYTSKVAQANILPDDIEYAPYTIYDRVVKDIPIDINIIKPSFMSDSKECFSQKAMFKSQEYLDSFSDSFLCLLKKNADPESGVFANAALFLSKVYENIVAKNFAVLNTFFVSLSVLPEWLIMMLWGFFGLIFWFILWFITTCLSIVYHVISIPELFKEKDETNKWESDENVSLVRFTKLILFFFIWLPLGIASTFITPFFLSIYALISPLYAKYDVNDSGSSYGIFDFVKNTFAYKKMYFFILATISLIMNGQKYLGTASLIGIAVAIIFAYIMGLYSGDMPMAEEGFTRKIRDKIVQASVEEINMSNPKIVQVCKSIPMDETIEKILAGNNVKRNIMKYVTNNTNNTNNTNTNNNNVLTGGSTSRTNKSYKIRLV